MVKSKKNSYLKDKQDKKKSVFSEFLRFSVVGSSGVIINLLILYLLTEKAGVYYIFSALLAFFVALTSNFILNKTWTFKEQIRDKIIKKYGKYFIVNLIALGINLVFLYTLTEFFGIFYLISQALAIGFATFFNFAGNKIWTFRSI